MVCSVLDHGTWEERSWACKVTRYSIWTSVSSYWSVSKASRTKHERQWIEGSVTQSCRTNGSGEVSQVRFNNNGRGEGHVYWDKWPCGSSILKKFGMLIWNLVI
jgi:hypothetical protein